MHTILKKFQLEKEELCYHGWLMHGNEEPHESWTNFSPNDRGETNLHQQ